MVCPYYIDTGMFRGVKSRFPLAAADPARGRRRRAHRRAPSSADQRQLILPPLVRLLPLMRVLPVGAFDWLARFLGVNASMDEFEGRGPH